MNIVSKGQALFLALAGILLAAFPGEAYGQPFVLNSVQSSITVSGSVQGTAITQQGSGSLRTTYSGTIQAQTTASSIRFTGGSRIIAANSGSWQPQIDGTAGNQPANYGAQVNLFIAQAVAAMRNLEVDAASGNIPLSNGQFDSRAMSVVFLTNANSTISYLVTGLISDSGSAPLSGTATNNSSTMATLGTTGIVQTLTLPVDATFYLTLISENDTQVRLRGQLVATRSVDVPFTLQVRAENQAAQLRWENPPGQFFTVLASPNLQQWQTAAVNVTSTSNTYLWSEPATSTARFYRVAR